MGRARCRRQVPIGSMAIAGRRFAMTDSVSPKKRSEIMRSVGSQNTRPEVATRRLLHGLGYRFRIHRRDLPGTPDIVFPSRKKVIFVHGCFWHQHDGCSKARMPKSRTHFWEEKFRRNRARDVRNVSDLREVGWMAAIVWECEIKRPTRLAEIVAETVAFVRR